MEPRRVVETLEELNTAERTSLNYFLPMGIRELKKGNYGSARQYFSDMAVRKIIPLAWYYSGITYLLEARSYLHADMSVAGSIGHVLDADRRTSLSLAYYEFNRALEEVKNKGYINYHYQPQLEQESGHLQCDLEFYLAVTCFQQKKYYEAITSCRKALQFDVRRNRDEMLFLLASIQISIGDLEAAMTNYIEALQLNPKVINSTQIFELLEKLSLESAIKYIKECLDEKTTLGKLIHSENGLFNRTVARAQQLLITKEAAIPANRCKKAIELLRAQLKVDNYQAAYTYGKEAYDCDPTNRDAIRGYALALHRSGRKDDAFNLINGAITSSPHEPKYLEMRARLHYDSRNDDAAMKDIDAAAAFGETPHLSCVRGLIFIERKNFIEGMENVKRGLTGEDLLVDKDYILQIIKKLPQPLKYKYAKEALDPTSPLGKIVAVQRGMSGRGVTTELRMIVSSHEQNVRILTSSLATYADAIDNQKLTANPELILADCKELLSFEPENVWAHRVMGKLFQHLKQYDKAIKSYKDARVLAPFALQATLFSHIAECYYRNDNMEMAIANATLAITVDPNTQLYLQRIKYCRMVNDYGKIIEDYITVLKLAPHLVNRKDIFVTIMKLPKEDALRYAGLCVTPEHVLSSKMYEVNDKEGYLEEIFKLLTSHSPAPLAPVTAETSAAPNVFTPIPVPVQVHDDLPPPYEVAVELERKAKETSQAWIFEQLVANNPPAAVSEPSTANESPTTTTSELPAAVCESSAATSEELKLVSKTTVEEDPVTEEEQYAENLSRFFSAMKVPQHEPEAPALQAPRVAAPKQLVEERPSGP